MAVTKRVRYEVLKRDNHTCRYCGGTAPDVVLTIDHVTPVALGGGDDPSNLVTACRDCNYGKASTSPTEQTVADVKAADIAWASAVKRAAAQLEAQREQRDDYVMAFGNEWERYGRKLNSTVSWASVERLYEAGLPRAEMLDAVAIACDAYGVQYRFNYFMGICWKKLTAIQETAKQLLAADEQGV